jgi:hypothetical protein
MLMRPSGRSSALGSGAGAPQERRDLVHVIVDVLELDGAGTDERGIEARKKLISERGRDHDDIREIENHDLAGAGDLLDPLAKLCAWKAPDEDRAELDKLYAAIPVFAVGTGLGPEEWIALERADIDREGAPGPCPPSLLAGRTPRGRQDGRLTIRAGSAASASSTRCRSGTVRIGSPPRAAATSTRRSSRHREWTPALRATGIATIAASTTVGTPSRAGRSRTTACR